MFSFSGKNSQARSTFDLQKVAIVRFCPKSIEPRLRWLDTVFQGQYLPSLSINYVAINKDLEKLPPQLYLFR